MCALACTRALVERLRRLEDGVAALQVTLNEDRPSPDAPALVDWYDNRIMEWLGELAEALEQAMEAQRELAHGAATARARLALWRTHELVLGVLRGYVAEVGAYGRKSELLRMGAARGREWQAWSQVMGRAIEECGPALCDAVADVGACWRELVDTTDPGPAALPGPGFAARLIAENGRRAP